MTPEQAQEIADVLERAAILIATRQAIFTCDAIGQACAHRGARYRDASEFYREMMKDCAGGWLWPRWWNAGPSVYELGSPQQPGTIQHHRFQALTLAKLSAIRYKEYLQNENPASKNG